MKTRIPRRNGFPHGFTLIELLTRAKSAASSTACKNNLRQLGMALSFYVDEFGATQQAGKPTEEPPVNVTGRWEVTVPTTQTQGYFRLRKPSSTLVLSTPTTGHSDYSMSTEDFPNSNPAGCTLQVRAL